MLTIDSLRNLAVKLGCCAKSADAVGDTVDEVIEYISENYKIPTLPTTAGDYKLVVSVSEGVASYSWVLITTE